jgi:hypothetical protein
MRAFISYAHEQRDLAERLALGLRNEGVKVFFDRDALPVGESFDDRIRRALLQSDCFIFLASADSLKKGAYPLTELNLAKTRWPRPAGWVLPVSVDGTTIDQLPPYLRAVSVLRPDGDAVAEALDASLALLHARRRKRTRRLATGVVVAVGVAGAIWFGPAATLRNYLTNSVVGSDDAGVDLNDQNSHVYGLKNAHQVRVVGSVVKNESNVADAIVQRAVESDAWQYNRCYDSSYGGLKEAMPRGSIVVRFHVLDQLPQHATLERSDFNDDGFNRCIVATLLDQTINEAGRGEGPVTYAFKFLPN